MLCRGRAITLSIPRGGWVGWVRSKPLLSAVGERRVVRQLKHCALIKLAPLNYKEMGLSSDGKPASLLFKAEVLL